MNPASIILWPLQQINLNYEIQSTLFRFHRDAFNQRRNASLLVFTTADPWCPPLKDFSIPFEDMVLVSVGDAQVCRWIGTWSYTHTKTEKKKKKGTFGSAFRTELRSQVHMFLKPERMDIEADKKGKMQWDHTAQVRRTRYSWIRSRLTNKWMVGEGGIYAWNGHFAPEWIL